MTAHSLTRPDAARWTSVDADDAGEVYWHAADGLIAILHATGQLDARQTATACELARLYGRGGYRSAWRRTGGGERDEAQVAAARRELREIIEAAPRRLQDGLWRIASEDAGGIWRNWLPVWREGLDAVADRLRLT